jgi:hypothetical protein
VRGILVVVLVGLAVPAAADTHKCPYPPSVDVPACWAVMPCPNPPDARVKACKPRWPPCDRAKPDGANPNCREPPKPVIGRVIKAIVSGNATILTVDIGSTDGITKHWRGALVTANDRPISNADVEILRIDRKVTVVKLKATVEVGATKRVRFAPP